MRIDRLGVTPSDAHVSNYDDSIYIDQEDETDLPLIFTVRGFTLVSLLDSSGFKKRCVHDVSVCDGVHVECV